MTTAIVLGVLAGEALSRYFAWPILVWASSAVLIFTGASEVMNGSSVGFTLLSMIINVTALQAGYFGGAMVQQIALSRRSKSAEEKRPAMRSRA